MAPANGVVELRAQIVDSSSWRGCRRWEPVDFFDDYGYPFDSNIVESILAAPGAYPWVVRDIHGNEWRPRPIEQIRAAAAAGDFISDFELSIWQHFVLPGYTSEMLGEDPAHATGETDLDPGILEYLLSDGDFEVRIGAACSPVRSDEEAFETLESDAFDDDWEELKKSARRESYNRRWLAPHTCDFLARSHVEVHRIVAALASTDADVLLEMAEDESGLVRRTACANHNAPEEIARRSADDLERLKTQAKDPETLPAVLNGLAADRDERVRRLVAEHPATPTRALWNLVGRVDDHHLVANPEAPSDLIETIVDRSSIFDEQVDETHSLLAAFARSTRVSPRVFYRLAELFRDHRVEDHVHLQVALVSNSAIPLDVLASYAEHPCGATRGLVAKNPSTPAEVLDALAADPDERVRLAVERVHRGRAEEAYLIEVANRTPAEQKAADAAVEEHLRWMKRLRYTRPLTYRHITKGTRQYTRITKSLRRTRRRDEKRRRKLE